MKVLFCILVFSSIATNFLGALKIKFVATDGAGDKTWEKCVVFYKESTGGKQLSLAARETRDDIDNTKVIARVDFVASGGTTTNWTGPELDLKGKSWIEFKIKKEGIVYKVRSSKSPEDYTVG